MKAMNDSMFFESPELSAATADLEDALHFLRTKLSDTPENQWERERIEKELSRRAKFDP